MLLSNCEKRSFPYTGYYPQAIRKARGVLLTPIAFLYHATRILSGFRKFRAYFIALLPGGKGMVLFLVVCRDRSRYCASAKS